MNFVAYHSGFEADVPEVPYTKATRNMGTNRLIWSMERSGIGPNENVYAEMGTSWWFVMRYPDQAAHFLGKLLRYVGEDNVLWGTDCLFYGSPQPMIQAMRSFQISAEFQERYGYPKLTKELKAKILGLNGAALYGVEPNTERCEFSRRELEQIRRKLPGPQPGARPDHDGRDASVPRRRPRAVGHDGDDARVERGRHPQSSISIPVWDGVAVDTAPGSTITGAPPGSVRGEARHARSPA